jgi:hypothetical protein
MSDPNRRHVGFALLGSAAWGLLAAPAAAQILTRRWRVIGTANTNSRGVDNPYFVLSRPEVQAIAERALGGLILPRFCGRPC